MHPSLERCREGLKRAVDGLSVADAEASVTGAWSIANVIEHLDLTFARNAAGLRRRLAKGDEPERTRTVRQAAIRVLIVKIGYFPSGRKSPDMVVPQGRPYEEVIAGLDGHLSDLDTVMAEGAKVLGATRAVLDHPVIGPFSIDDWRAFHWIHTRHHIKQIDQRRGR